MPSSLLPCTHDHHLLLCADRPAEIALDLLAPLSRTVVAPLWAVWERSPYLRHYRRLRRTQYDPPEVIRRRQEEQVRRLVAHACRTTEFYRERFAAAGLRAESIDSLDAFCTVPLTTKADLREFGPQLRSTDCPTRQLHHKKTSGSTGVSVEVFVDDAAQQFKRACTLRSDEWSGWRLGERVAAVWGNPEYLKRGWRGRLRNALLDRATYLDTLKMDEAAMARFADTLHRRPPSLLFGHAHSLYLFAEFIRSSGAGGHSAQGDHLHGHGPARLGTPRSKRSSSARSLTATAARR